MKPEELQTKRQHRLSEIDPLTKTAVCAICGPVDIVRKAQGTGKPAHWRCKVNARQNHTTGKVARSKLNSVCERCGFVPEHICQLVGKRLKDGDIQTLCANCNALAELAPKAGTNGTIKRFWGERGRRR